MKKLYLLFLVFMLSISAFAAEAPSEETSTESQTQSVSDMYTNLTTFIAENGVSLVLNLIAAAAIFFIGRWLAKLIANLFKKAMTKSAVDPTLTTFFRNLIYAALMVFVIISAIGQIGIKTGSFIAVVGAAGLAIGLALQGSLANFAAGVLLILFKPFKTGDYIDAAGTAGSVEEIHIFNTVLNTPDNCKIIIPNAQITGGNIKNYSANPTRRVDLVIGVSYEDDLRKARQVIEDVIKADNRVLQEPVCTVAVSELGDSSVNFVVRPWVNGSDYWAVRFDLIEKIKVALEENGLTIPFPQRDVHLFNAPAS